MGYGGTFRQLRHRAVPAIRYEAVKGIEEELALAHAFGVS